MTQIVENLDELSGTYPVAVLGLTAAETMFLIHFVLYEDDAGVPARMRYGRERLAILMRARADDVHGATGRPSEAALILLDVTEKVEAMTAEDADRLLGWVIAYQQCEQILADRAAG